MREIAGSADITVGTIYHYFASKQAILQEIMMRTLRGSMSATRKALLHTGPTPTDQLAGLVRAWTIFHTKWRAEAFVSASEMRSLDDPGRRIVVLLRDEQERMFRDVVQRGVAVGAFMTPYPDEAARAIIGMGITIATWYQPDGPLAAGDLATIYVDLAIATVRTNADWPFEMEVDGEFSTVL